MAYGGIYRARVMNVATCLYKTDLKCFESVTLIQPQYKGGAFKGPSGKSPKANVRLPRKSLD